jgi:hypothetical protein
MTEENNNPGNDPEKVDQNKPGNDPEKNENMIPKARFDQVNQQKNELNDTLKGLVDELKADIPEDFQDLIPEMKPADQIKWIRNATKKGIFTKKVESGPDSETPNKGTKQIDTTGMSTFDMLSHGFKNIKK